MSDISHKPTSNLITAEVSASQLDNSIYLRPNWCLERRSLTPMKARDPLINRGIRDLEIRLKDFTWT